MGMTIAIDKSIMNKMPQSCKECPLTYLDMGDDAYFGANEKRCVLDDSCVGTDIDILSEQINEIVEIRQRLGRINRYANKFKYWDKPKENEDV